MEAYLAKDPSLKESAQRAFVSYVKAVFLMKDKSVFNVQSLDTDSFAHSFGLAIPPRIRFLQRMNARKEANKSSKDQNSINNNNKKYFDIEGGEGNETEEGEENHSLSQTKGEKNNLGSSQFHMSDGDESDDDILKLKRKDHDIELPTEQELLELSMNKSKNKKAVTKAAVAKKIIKKNIVPNKKIVFTDEGDAVTVGLKEKKSELAIQYEQEDAPGIDIETAKKVLRAEDKFDKQLFKEKVKAKHKETKRKLKKKKQNKEEEEFSASESEEEPDLSWLPDPDQVYGEKTEEEIEELENSVNLELKPEKQKRFVLGIILSLPKITFVYKGVKLK